MVHPIERVFPDGVAKLIVMLDDPHRDGSTERLDPFPNVCIEGLTTRPEIVVSPRGRCRVLGICFQPAGACALLRGSMHDVRDVTIDLRDAIGSAADELGERCSSAARTSPWNSERNAVAVIHTAINWTEHRMQRDWINDQIVEWTTETIRSARGNVSIEEIGSNIGISRVRLAQRFKERVGVTPKRFARLIRFSHAIALLGRIANVASAAAELAYYDQAHLYRDFNEFAGMTPGEFLSARRYPGSGSLAEG